MPPSKAKKEKLKYFRCEICNTIETQEWAVVAVSHSHKGKLIQCERVNKDGSKIQMLKPGVGEHAKRSKTSTYVDGTDGRTKIQTI